MTIQRISLLTIALCFSVSTMAADQAREERLAEAAISTVAKNIPQWLQTEDGRFLALFDNNMSGQTQGGVILLPPLGAHPNWPGVIRHLRTSLPRHGWSTLSIQMPVLDANSIIKDYLATLTTTTARINAAISFMQRQGINNISLIGQGLGSASGAAYLAAQTDTQIHAFIGISMSGYSEIGDWLYSPNSIQNLALPILDIYGSHDYQHVINSANARADAARRASLTNSGRFNLAAKAHLATAESAQTRRAGYIAYRRIKLTGGNAQFNGIEKQLVKRVIGWLKKNAGAMMMSKGEN